MDDWPALTECTFAWFGELDVEVHGNRAIDAEYERHFRAHCETMRFGDFVALLEPDLESNDFYLVGRNYAFECDELRGLLDDLGTPEGFLDPAHKDPNNVKLTPARRSSAPASLIPTCHNTTA
jgi:hypothetical protein